MWRPHWLALALSCGLVACGACGGSGGGPGGSSTTGAGTTGATTSATTSTALGTGTGPKPPPPTFETLKPSPGGLKLTWSVQGPCETLEGWRKDGLNAYARVFSVPGAQLAQPDATATGNFNYTFHLRCLAGDVYSDWSHEQSANPQTTNP